MEKIIVKNHGIATLYANIGMLVLNVVTRLLGFSAMPDCGAYDMVLDRAVKPMPDKDAARKLLLSVKYSELSRLMAVLFHVHAMPSRNNTDFEYEDASSSICVCRTANRVLVYCEGDAQYRYCVDWDTDMETTLKPMLDAIVADVRTLNDEI